MTRWGWSNRRAAKESAGIKWLRPFSAAVPWITVILLLLMFHMIGGTLTSSSGTLFELPNSGTDEGVATKLVALVMPKSRESRNRETLIFFDDARYILGDESSERGFSEHLSERVRKMKENSFLILADWRVSGGDLMRLSSIAKKAGVERILFAERKERVSE